MLERIISFSIKNKLVVSLFVISLIVWGLYETIRLPIDAVPDITDDQVQVITVSPSLGAPDVERLISFPIEQACSNVPGIKQIRSFSRFGLSLVTIVFNDGTDVYWGRQQVNERLQTITKSLPLGIGTPEMAPVTTGLGEIYQYVVRPLKGYEGKYDAMALRTLQDWVVRRQLLGTPGVAEVASFGGKLKQYEIAVRQEQLKAFNLTIKDVFDALEKNNENTGGAYIEKGPTVLYIRSEGLTKTIEDIQKIVVKTTASGIPVLIRDLANVQFGSAIRYGAMTYNDQGEVAGAVVMMLKGENSSEVIKLVKLRIAEIQKMMPEGVVIEPFLDRTKMVNNAISTVETNLTEGALIVILVLVFFLGNLRAGLIVASVIPLAMLFAIILMNKFGVGGNLMSLGAIDFGLIVEGSVIVVEAILHRFMHSKHFRGMSKISSADMDIEVGKSTTLMIRSAVFSQVIILIVYLPILSLQGIEGKMFKPMAFTIAFAILGAFLLSVTYVPMMASLVLSKNLNHTKSLADLFMAWLERKYQPILIKMLAIPKTLIISAIALFIVSVIILTKMGGEFIPQLEEGDFAVETRLLTGSNLTNTIHATQQASAILLKEFPEVQKVVTKIGSAEIPTDPMPFEAGDMMVILKDKKEWTSAKTFDEMSSKMTHSLESIPGITVGFQFPVQMRFNELMTGARQDVVCKIFGENLDSLSNYAHKLNNIIRSVNGAVNIYEDTVTGMPQVVIRYNRDAMAKYGLNVSDVNKVVNTAFAGQVAGQVYEEEKKFDIVVRLAGDARSSLGDIQSLLIPTAQGTQIPLSMVAGIEEKEGVNQVQRENTHRRIIVGFNINGHDVKTIVNELQQKVKHELNLSKGYTIVYGGSFENMNAAKDRLSIVVPIALALIFLLLYFAFNSVKQGLLIYSAIPLSATGGIFSLWIRGMPFSISAGVGFIALFGVAVLNGILLVSEFNKLKKEGWHDTKRIVIHATKSKLRAILMTALVPALGFIPMAISTGAGGEVQKPLATVVIGGLILSTLLTLFLLPTLYCVAEKKSIVLKKEIISATMLLLIFCLPGSAKAQESITINNAIDSAIINNLKLKVADDEVAYYKAVRKGAVDIDKTMFDFEYGKFNTIQSDNKFGVSQTIQFPTVYKHQQEIYNGNIRLSEFNKQQRIAELKYAVKQTFYALLIINGKEQLLQYADSIYKTFLVQSNIRFKNGDIDKSEIVLVENQLAQISNQQLQLSTDKDALLQHFNLLLNASNIKIPFATSVIYSTPQFIDINEFSNNPLLKYKKELIMQAEKTKKLEKSRMFPTVTLGYNNASMIGWQTIANNTEQYFGKQDRFSWMNVALGIPIFYKAQQSRIAAADRLKTQYEDELASQNQELLANWRNLQNARINLIAVQKSYEAIQLPNSETIIENANRKLQLGELNYLNWTIMVNHVLEVKAEYFEVLRKLNEVEFSIEKIINTN